MVDERSIDMNKQQRSISQENDFVRMSVLSDRRTIYTQSSYFKSKVNKYVKHYEGYISTHDHVQANAEELAALATAIRNSIEQHKAAL